MTRTFLAMLVIVTRLMASLLPMPADADAGQPYDAVSGSLLLAAICHAESPSDGAQLPARHDHPAGHAHDCCLCPICHALAAPALLAAGPADLPTHALPPRVRQVLVPPATGPPSLARTAARPRGPPSVSV